MFITRSAAVMGFVMTSERTAASLGEWMVSFTDDKYVVLEIVAVALLVMGVFLEAIPGC